MASISDPADDGYVATPANADLPRGIGDFLYVFADGNLTFTTMGGKLIGPYAVTAGQVIPFRVRQINVGTTATIVVGVHK